jgi:hypothetical protein
VVVVCAVLAAVGVFLPNIQVELGGIALSRRTSMSLYQIDKSRVVVRHLIARYHRSGGKKLGAVVEHHVMPHLGGRVHEALDDATSAMDVLDDVSDDQARTGSQIFQVLVWVLLALEGLIAALVFVEIVNGTMRKSRVIGALVVSVLATPIAIGMSVMTYALVYEANDEIGVDMVGATVGAYVIPIAALVGLIASVVLLAKRPRDLSRPRTT